MKRNINKVIIIPQLKDNYAYGIINDNNLIIIDPAEHLTIIDYIKKNSLNLKAILITHHHADHTAGINGILKLFKIPVYSPNIKILGTSNIIKENDIINLEFIKLNVIHTPGHTLDHVVFYNEFDKMLFSGDTLFRLGCGRVFEGTYKQMYNSLNKIYSIDNDTMVYCGHEYTETNLNFLNSIFFDNKDLKSAKVKILDQISKTGKSIPFNLGQEKALNPFLSSKSSQYSKYKKDKNLTDFEMFMYLRDLKNKF